jgi:hypothetical protein
MLATMRTLAAVLTLAVIAYAIPAHADTIADALVSAQAASERQDYATEFKLLQGRGYCPRYAHMPQ